MNQTVTLPDAGLKTEDCRLPTEDCRLKIAY